ncbi:hypothetical protein KPH14_008786 [Odynerus spinipes]|uniref:Uncharacterized protein n=1 Tax=Odynerus spinipes TaxID=1348599 RepID=A0AAD9VHU0_9HYME|nr:hypothetical protein KPH14_008786 [Odynerus spinipes]
MRSTSIDARLPTPFLRICAFSKPEDKISLTVERARLCSPCVPENRRVASSTPDSVPLQSRVEEEKQKEPRNSSPRFTFFLSLAGCTKP